MTNVVAFRKFPSRPEDEIRSLHSPFLPAEVYQTDPVQISLRFSNGIQNELKGLKVYRISPLGVEVDITSLGPDVRGAISPSQDLDATLLIGGQVCEFRGLTVSTKHREESKELLGIRWCRSTAPETADSERRKNKRWLCGDEFLPTGVAPNPTRFNDYLVFRVLDISGTGMHLATSMRNKYLVPGMQLEATITFPMVAPISLYLRIVNARITQKENGDDYLSLGVQYLDPDRKALESIGQYVLQFGPASTAEDLRAQGLHVRHVVSALDFSYVKSADEYREVLRLRHAAYSACGKLNPLSTPEQCGDLFDTRAKILIARHRGRLVGSLRIMFHDPEDSMEHEQFVALPESFPRKDEMVEVTRVCTDPNYRGADLFYGLMKHMMLTIAQSKRRWLIGSATNKLMPLYEKIGFRGAGQRFTHADLGNQEHELILGDIPKIISGVGVSPVLWNELYADVSDYLKDQHGYEFDPLLNIRMAAYRAVGPITKIFTRHIRRPHSS